MSFYSKIKIVTIFDHLHLIISKLIGIKQPCVAAKSSIKIGI